MQLFQRIAIFAGNSRAYLDPATGEVTVEAQIAAFRAGLMRAAEIQALDGQLPHISVAFDHMGIFGKQFLGDGLTNSQKRHPRLSQLRSEIVDVFQAVSDDLGIPLSEVHVIREDAARDHASRVTDTADFPTDLLDVFLRKLNTGEEEEMEIFKQSGDHYVRRVTCAAITTEYFTNAAGNAELLEVFIEEDGWTKEALYKRGAGLLGRLGRSFGVSLHMVDKQSGAIRPFSYGDNSLTQLARAIA